MPVKQRTPTPKIGDLIAACKDGRIAAEHGRECKAPRWVTGSPTLRMAFFEGYELARRSQKGATDGPAR